MSSAAAVYHGPFGRVCIFANDRTMVPHGHREGHLLFHVQGPPGELVVEDRSYQLAPGSGVAISPWQSHYYRHHDGPDPVVVLVLYIRPSWFLEASRQVSSTLSFGRVPIEVTSQMARTVYATAQSVMEAEESGGLIEERVSHLTQAAFDQSWQWTERGRGLGGSGLQLRDFRIRNAMRLMQEQVGEPLALDGIAREVGLSRPHFYKLFRQQMRVTPNVYLNTLRMERAIERLTGSHQAVADIGLDLGFSSQASFSRFFIANGVVAPSVYRRSVQLADSA